MPLSAARLVIMLSVALLLIAGGGDPDEQKAAPPPVGSQAILDRLWTAEALRGKPAEATATRLRPPDRTPPSRLAPAVTLPPVPAKLQNSIRRFRPVNDARLVALTFDLCEEAHEVAGYQGGVVDYLRAEKVPATFFAGGKWLRSHPERAMQLIADPLFEVGNHGWTHGNLRRLEAERAETEIAWPQAQYQELRETLAARARQQGLGEVEIEKIPVAPRSFRFPYGVCSPASLALAARLGLTAIQWDVVSGDADPALPAEKIARGVIAEVKPGSIVVMHANGRGIRTAEALPKMIAGLRAKGYRFVTVSDLLRSGEPVTTSECYELKPGDNLRYDAWKQKPRQ